MRMKNFDSNLIREELKMFVPVVSKNQKQLMPTSCSRARRWIKNGRATPFWKLGVFCIRMNEEVKENVQEICIGIDPGSKREGFTVKSKAHTYLNVLSNSVTWVKDKIETRRMLRRSRRFRNTPYRKCRSNRKVNPFLPSTKSRWDLKLRITNKLRKIFLISSFNIEDIKALTKPGKKKWNSSFSPIEYGKKYFYEELSKLGRVYKTQGYDTYNFRIALGLKKTSDKLSDCFEAHNVDSWLLADMIVGGHWKPDNIEVLRIVPLNFQRRQLYKLQIPKGGIKIRQGGTISLGFKKGSLVRHKKHGLTFVGGNGIKGISLQRLFDGNRLCQNAKKHDMKFLSFNSFRTFNIKNNEKY